MGNMRRTCGIEKGNFMQFDTIIIGGGPGGTRAATVLSKAGKSVALVSKELGGECLNYGCIPTKIYLWAAELFEKINGAAAAGVDVENPRMNWEQMKKRRLELVAKLQKNLTWSLEKAGIKIFEGVGEIQDTNTVKITKANGTQEVLTAEFLIIATGSEPIFPPGYDNGIALNNHEIIDLPSVPKTLLILGGGASGVEFTSIFASLGTKVTIAERGDRLLPHLDLDVSAEIERVFTRKNIEIVKNLSISPVEAKKFEKVLVAIGRRPTVDKEAMNKLGIKHSPRGIETSEYLQTNVPTIFAIGDIAGKSFLAYTAEAEGNVAAEFILGRKPDTINYNAIPNTIFCIPEIATVGLSESRAKEKGVDCVIGKAAYSANAKALILGNRDGFAKIVAERSSGKILGVHIVGEKASELIAEASLAVTLGLKTHEFAKNIHGHPIFAEILKDACT